MKHWMRGGVRIDHVRITCWLIVGVIAQLILLAYATPVLAQQPGITSPATGDSVGGDTSIMGTAVIDPFQKYELHYKLEPSGDDAYVYFDGGTSQIVNNRLGNWAAAGLPPGTYSIRLRVVKADGNYAEYFAQNINVNQEPTPTPTSSEPTPTPIPTSTFTPAPQPTPNVGQVVQPVTEEPTATPVTGDGAGSEAAVAIELPTQNNETQNSATVADAQSPAAAPTGGSISRQIGEAFALNRLRGAFFDGVRLSATLFFAIVLLFVGKRLFNWLWMQYR